MNICASSADIPTPKSITTEETLTLEALIAEKGAKARPIMHAARYTITGCSF
jgi:hypothetical protein